MLQLLLIMKQESSLIINKNNFKGFTLIEVLVVIVIIGLSAALMLPNYQSFLKKSEQTQCDQIAYSVREALYDKIMVGFLDSYYVYPFKALKSNTIENQLVDNIDKSIYERFIKYAFLEKPFAYKRTILFQKAIIDEETKTGESYLEIECENKDRISFVFLVSDHLDDSYDTAIIVCFTYFHHNGYQITLLFQ